MEIRKKYVVYGLRNILETNALALVEIEFDRYMINSFDTEEEAIQALIEDEKTYQEYLILPNIYIRKDTNFGFF